MPETEAVAVMRHPMFYIDAGAEAGGGAAAAAAGCGEGGGGKGGGGCDSISPVSSALESGQPALEEGSPSRRRRRGQPPVCNPKGAPLERMPEERPASESLAPSSPAVAAIAGGGGGGGGSSFSLNNALAAVAAVIAGRFGGGAEVSPPASVGSSEGGDGSGSGSRGTGCSVEESERRRTILSSGMLVMTPSRAGSE